MWLICWGPSMPVNHRPRKKYRPKPINAPVTDGLVKMFSDCLSVAELGLHLRAPTTDHFDSIAAALNVIGPVAIDRLGDANSNAAAITSAAQAMNEAADRAAQGDGRMTDAELASVTRGISAAMDALPLLDIRSLYRQHYQVLRRQVAGAV